MAAELIGTTIGVVGVLGQLFDGCVKAYGYFTTAANLDADSQRMLCKVRIEEMRLVVWGREWGVAEGKLEAHLCSSSGGGGGGGGSGWVAGQNPQLRVLATQILEELHGTVTDFKRLREKYGLDDAERVESGNGEKAGKNGKGAGGGGNGNGDANGKNASKSERSWRKEIGLRTKWVIQDKEKFINLLRDLKDFNDGLERLFPPSQLPSFQRAWTNRLLESAQRDLTQLSLLETASSGIYPRLQTSANLKKLRINLDLNPEASFKPTFALKVHWSSLEFASSSSSSSSTASKPSSTATTTTNNGTAAATTNKAPTHSHATHVSAGPVLVEWIPYDREALDERVSHLKRLDDLARMMHSASSRHPDLHSIDCVGYTDDTASARYGLVYKAPHTSYSTLSTLISSPDLKTPDLNDRVRLATKLAVALWSLHSLDWLHKSLCGSNVLFFPSAFASSAQGTTATAAVVPDISDPRLAGFGASRPDLDVALSVVPRSPSIGELHRHPDSLRGGRPHVKAFDVYSLGLALLEIGLWKLLQSYYKPHYSAERWRDRVVLPVLVPGLASKVGRTYRDVVDMCIRVDGDLSSSEAGDLMEKVVVMLESIHV